MQLLNKDGIVWWDNNPMDSISGSHRHLSASLLFYEFELMGFIDGSLTKLKDGRYISGIEWVIKQTDGTKVLRFSGPGNATKIIDVKIATFRTLINLLNQSDMKASNILVYSDSKELVRMFKENKFFQELILELVNKGWKIRAKKLAREFNFDANSLAKFGASQK